MAPTAFEEALDRYAEAVRNTQTALDAPCPRPGEYETEKRVEDETRAAVVHAHEHPQ